MKIQISFVLAAYNEEENVVPLINQIVSAMQELCPYEILFVVEGEDQTCERLKWYQINNPEVSLRYLYSKEKLGLMNAIRKGCENITEESTHVVTMDVDLNHNPSDLKKLLAVAVKGEDIVIGSRYMKDSVIRGIPVWKRLVSSFTNSLFNWMFSIEILDKTSGYRMFNIETSKEILPLVASENFEGLMEFLLIANKKKKKIREVPITFTYRMFGESKFNLLLTIFDYSKLFLRANSINKET